MNGLQPLTDDEAALMYHVIRWGSAGYPIARIGRKWAWHDWRSVKGPPTTYRTKRDATAAFEGWCSLAAERWRAMRLTQPNAILTAVGVR